MKFYPSDWRADQGLRVCSLAARGLWIECMAIMHEADPYGHLVVNGHPVTDTQLATLTGTDPSTVQLLLRELETAGVYSRTRKAVIYSRRMTRDERRRKDGETAQKTGGKLPNSRREQRTEKQRENKPPPEVARGAEERPPPPLEARGQNKESSSHHSIRSDIGRVVDEVWALSGIDPGPKRVAGYLGDFRAARDWLEAGYLADEIVDAARAVLSGRTVRDPWAYLGKVMADAVAAVRAEASRGSAGGDGCGGVPWDQRLLRFGENGFWMDSWGQKPGNAGCLAPVEVLRRHGFGG